MRVPIRQYVRLLGAYVRPQWRWMVALAILILATIGLRLANPQITICKVYTQLAFFQSRCGWSVAGCGITLNLNS